MDAPTLGDQAAVVVTEDVTSDGQFWIRHCGRKARFPHVVHNSKRFAGPTGLEEYIGFGIGMALGVEAQEGALSFKSHHYFVQVLGHPIPLPGFLSPGTLIIGHHDPGGGRFLFSLSFRNRLFGELIRQDVLFDDEKE